VASQSPQGLGENEGAPRERARALRTMLVLRVVIVTALLGSALYVQIFYGLTSDSLYFIIGLTYILTLFYAVLAVPFRASRLFAFVQLLIDVALVSLLVLVTGAADSAFIILYYLVVVSAAIMLGRLASFVLATLSGALFAAVVMAANGGLLDLSILYPYFHPELNTLLYRIGLHFFALELLAALSGGLAGMLQMTASRLRQRTADLERLRVLNESIVRSIPTGLITTNLEGVISFANPSAVEMTQTQGSEIIGLNVRFLLLYNPEAPEPFFSDEGWNREMWLLRGDGSRIDVSVSRTLLIGDDGRLTGKLYAIQDLREIKALQAQLRLQDQMAAAGELSAAIAHEIRNPLGAISGSAQMIRKATNLPDDQRYFMDIIVRESQRLSSILNDFLKFAREPSFAPEQVDILQVARETVDLLAKGEEVTRRHQIEFDCNDLESLHALIDPNMLRQLIYNLASNGMRAMPDGGILKISMRHSGEEAVLEVCDSGVGIPREQQQRLFKPFTSFTSGGVGLGMAIVYRIVQAHGGTIRVRSMEGKGTRVTVALPVSGGNPSDFRVVVEEAEP